MKKLPHFYKDVSMANMDPACYVPSSMLCPFVTCKAPTPHLARAVLLRSDSLTTLLLPGPFSLPGTLTTSCSLNRPVEGSLALCHIIHSYCPDFQSASHATPVVFTTSHWVLWDKLSPPASLWSGSLLSLFLLFILKNPHLCSFPGYAP